MPSTGVVNYLKEPTGPGVRVESMLYEGCEVSLYYDPMVAKLIVWGDTRAEAILRMRRSLNEYRIGGIRTSIPFHQELMDSPEFMWGTFDTGFLSRRRVSARHPHSEEHEKLAAVVAAMIAHEEGRHAVARVGQGDDGGQHSGEPVEAVRAHARTKGALVKYYARIGNNEYEVDISSNGMLLDGEPVVVDLVNSGSPELFSVLVRRAQLRNADRRSTASTTPSTCAASSSTCRSKTSGHDGSIVGASCRRCPTANWPSLRRSLGWWSRCWCRWAMPSRRGSHWLSSRR